MTNNICVYCSSSNILEEIYYEEARTLGRLMAVRGFGLVYGGGNVGLMGALAKSVHLHHGHVFGVIPRALKNREGVAYEIADELVITDSMRERKAIMYENSSAFIALPGGIGTLEEFTETLTLKQLGYHRLPIVIVNTNDFYTPLLELFKHYHRERFVHDAYKSLFFVANSAQEALSILQDHISI